jgi:hypothetical protein
MNLRSVWFSRPPIVLEMRPDVFEPVVEDTLWALIRRHPQHKRLSPTRPSRLGLAAGAVDIQSVGCGVINGRTLTYSRLVVSAAVPPRFRAVKASNALYLATPFTATRRCASLLPARDMRNETGPVCRSNRSLAIGCTTWIGPPPDELQSQPSRADRWRPFRQYLVNLSTVT